MTGGNAKRTWLVRMMSVLLTFVLLMTGPAGMKALAMEEGAHIVTLQADKGVRVTDAEGKALETETEVKNGGEFRFLATAEEEEAALNVLVNGQELQAQEGVFVVTDITEDKLIAIAAVLPEKEKMQVDGQPAKKRDDAQAKPVDQAADKQGTDEKAGQEEEKEGRESAKTVETYAVQLPENNDRFKLFSEQDARNVTCGGTFSFVLMPGERYIGKIMPVVTANGVTLAGRETDDGLWAFAIKGIYENIRVRVNDAEWDQQYCRIQLPKDNECFTVMRETDKAVYGEDYTFVIVPAAAYKNEAAPKVYANEKAVGVQNKNGNWVCTLENVTRDCMVAVDVSHWQMEGAWVELIPAEGVTYKNIRGGQKTAENKYTVPMKGSLSFEVETAKGYDSKKLVVKAGKDVILPQKGVYTVRNIQSDTQVTASAPRQFAHVVRFPAGKGYKVTDIQGGLLLEKYSVGIKENGKLSFKVSVEKGYDADALRVSANGKLLTAQKGVYSIANIHGDVEVEIWFEGKSSHIVSLPFGEGYSVVDVRGGKALGAGDYAVVHGGALSFYVRVEKGYNEEELVVSANGKTILPNRGLYTIENTQRDTAVKIGFEKAPAYFVEFSEGEGYEIMEVKGGVRVGEGLFNVRAGGSLSFEVFVRAAYQDKRLTVEANGKALKPVQGVYTLENIDRDTKVRIGFDENLQKFSITDKATGIRVSGYGKGVPELRVAKLSEKTKRYQKLQGTMENWKVLGAYEISLSGVKTEGEVAVSFPVSTKYDGRSMRIARLKANGGIAAYKAKAQNGRATVTVEALGEFMLAGVHNPNVVLPPKTGENSDAAGLWLCLLGAGSLALTKKRSNRTGV